ncbi:50S ribosomal protein L19e [Candidatus Woesearchaeota archaeon]|nr:50S ribosomal protein L19e [Candidatus Woesearchaeota archaeon]
MDLKVQRRIAAQLLKCSPKRVRFKQDALQQIKEAITKDDIRALIKDGSIQKIPVKGVSRARAKYNKLQKILGRRRGHGSRKGTKNARLNTKEKWMSQIRAQRKLLAELKNSGVIPKTLYRKLYLKSKGGFFRSRRHILMFLKDQGFDVSQFEQKLVRKKRNVKARKWKLLAKQKQEKQVAKLDKEKPGEKQEIKKQDKKQEPEKQEKKKASVTKSKAKPKQRASKVKQ